MSGFDRASRYAWILSDSVKGWRRRRLLRPVSIEGIVENLRRNSRVECVRRERASGGQAGHRSVVVLRATARVLDQFFNSCSGYRAQYLVRPTLGNKANRYVICEMLPKVLAAITSESKRAFVEASLAHPWAKVWIHQGAWLRRARRKDRVLLVDSWQAELRARDRDRRKLARWGTLAPKNETRFMIKGGFVHGINRVKSGKPPLVRARELHELGFT